MKKQINSVSNWSVKSGISLTVLCAFLGATELNANNYSSATLNAVTKQVKTEAKVENGMNRITNRTVVNNNDELVEEQVTDAISQWMTDKSYWSSDDFNQNGQKGTTVKEKSLKTDPREAELPTEYIPFKINVENYIHLGEN